MVTVVEESGNSKLSRNSNVSATWVPQVTCPDACPLQKNGCYAEQGRAGLHAFRLNEKAKRSKIGKAKLIKLLAEKEAKLIRGLTGTRKLRVHVLGDSSTPYAAKVVGSAMVAHSKKHGKQAWTYTHAFRTVPAKAWNGANVVASCEDVSDIEIAKKQGYKAVALIVPAHPTNKVYQFKGVNVVPCPAQFKTNGTRSVTCEDCNLCQRPLLEQKNLVIGFQPDGQTGKRVLRLIGVSNEQNSDRGSVRAAASGCGGTANTP